MATLAAGTYTIEATTFAAGATGSFTLTVAGLGADVSTPTDDCVEDLGTLGTVPGRFSVGRIGQTWTSECPSANQAGSYARYYSFTLGTRGEVTITLDSGDADPFLYLLEGAGRDGDVEAENDDYEGSRTQSQIQETLEVGPYTIEATTYSAGQTGRFDLTVIEPATFSPQRAALLALYQATGGENWHRNTNWGDATKPLGEWYGVTTDGQGQVIGLDLRNNQLTGALPADLAWDAFTDLEWLDLNGNTLTGPIPAELGDLSLFVLDLGNNRLSGPIPSQLGNVGSLTEMHLQGNQLSGAIPPQLGRLSRLRVAGLSDNRLAGQIPAQLGDMSNLRVLSLNDNQLTGPIPAELGNLSELQWLNLQRNQLSGRIPEELGNLSNLNGLRLSINRLTGPIPGELGNLSNLTRLALHINRLSGEIPSALGKLSNLQALYISNNQLTGQIPEELGLLLDLTELYLGVTNQLTGCIPDALRDVSRNDLERLGLLFCGLPPAPPPGDGPDRAALVALYNATDGDNWRYNDNWLSDAPLGDWYGVITDEEDGRVVALILKNNWLAGTLPPDLGRLSNLRWLGLEDNQLTRRIPDELGDLANLSWLGLEGNRLSGPIPDELGNLSSLERLYLGNNRLDGEIPSDLGHLSNLVVLDLGSNRLTGGIPAELGRLASLKYLYLDNQDYFRGKQGHPSGWDPAYLNDDSNYLHGAIPSALGSLSNLEALHLHNNRLSGAIPSGLGRLSNLLSLSLSRNFLSGAIPPALTNLSSLEALDLRRNWLTGEIPSALANLSNLTELRLIGNDWAGCASTTLHDVPINDLDQLYLPSCTSRGTSVTLGRGARPMSSHDHAGDRAVLESILDQQDKYRGWQNLWNNNDPDESIGDWYGVTISSRPGDCHGRVIEIKIRDKNLSGSIPPQLGELSCLTKLELSDTIHWCLRGRWKLVSIRCGLTGDIPEELGNLSLTEVNLSNNKLQGGIKWVYPKDHIEEYVLFFDGNPWEGDDKPLADIASAATAIAVDKLQGKVTDALIGRVEKKALVVATREGGKRFVKVWFKTVLPAGGHAITVYEWVDFAFLDGEFPAEDYLKILEGASLLILDKVIDYIEPLGTAIREHTEGPRKYLECMEKNQNNQAICQDYDFWWE